MNKIIETKNLNKLEEKELLEINGGGNFWDDYSIIGKGVETTAVIAGALYTAGYTLGKMSGRGR
ncbi:hypothetical protein [Bacillus mycoides]|uniref:hypothetical protein n=1 Tax=Bacillus mycoides TaxID=1405 RepID=UPI001FDE1B17|nr:hypothetical protein [Bacillus mycoides]CAH2465610.1 hypothetical protein ACOSJ1_EBGNOMHC_05595 [Bacillus mycoides KBAB4]